MGNSTNTHKKPKQICASLQNARNRVFSIDVSTLKCYNAIVKQVLMQGGQSPIRRLKGEKMFALLEIAAVPIIIGIAIGAVLLINIIVALVKGTITNIIVVDVLLIIVGLAWLLNSLGIHIVFSILLGIAGGICFVLLTRIPYFGKGFVTLCGFVWAFGLYNLIDDWGIAYKVFDTLEYIKDEHVLSKMLNDDPIMWWTIVIIMNIVFVGLHLKCVIKSTQKQFEDISAAKTDLYPAVVERPVEEGSEIDILSKQILSNFESDKNNNKK